MYEKISKQMQKVYDNAVCLYTKQEIETALDLMAEDITNKLHDKSPIFLCVMQGGIVTTGNLLVRLDFPLETDYIHATRYQGKCEGAEIAWKAYPVSEMKGRIVVIVDDILDEGITLDAIKKYCLEKGAAQVLTSVLLNKKKARKVVGLDKPDFRAIEIGNEFVIGYGLDFDGYMRNIPGIYVVRMKEKEDDK